MRKLIPLVLVLSLISCSSQNFAISLKLAIAAGAPILTVLVAQGKISPQFKGILVLDLSNEALAVGDMATCFQAIPKDDPQSKLKHLECVQTLDRSPATQKLLTDFGSNPTVANIGMDVDAIIQAAIIFYGGTPVSRATSGAARVIKVSQPVTEKTIEAQIKKLRRDMGQ